MDISMRAYVSPIGYDSSRVTRTVISNGLDTDDWIILLRPAIEMDDNRATQAIRDVRQMLSQVEPDTSITIEEIPHDDYEAAVTRICEILDAFDGELILNLSGGPRDILLALSTAAFVYHDSIAEYLSYSDIDGEVRSLPIPNLVVDTPSASFRTLEVIEDFGRPVSISELTEAREIAKSTITRHLQQLESRKLVDTWQEGKAKFTDITFTGRLMVRTKADTNH